MPWVSWRAVARQALRRDPVRSAVRALTRSSALPWTVRTCLHRRLGKHASLRDLPPFDVQRPGGARLRFAHGSTADYLWWLGAYEPTSTELFCRLAADTSLILDVGARDGIYALFAAAANPQAWVIAFEADPEVVQTLRFNVALNASLEIGRMTVVDVALGAEDGEAQFYLAGGNSSLNANFRPGAVPSQVTVRRGDSILSELAFGRPVGLVKIDTESTEPDVLAGLKDTIHRDRPVVLCEVLPGRTEDRLQAFVDDSGYAVWSLTGGGLRRLASVAGDPTYRQPNVLLAPSEWVVPSDIPVR